MKTAPDAGTRVGSRTILLAALGVAVLLRFLFLGRESLWIDEAASWWFSSDVSHAWRSEPTNPPTYYLLLHFWRECFGSSEAALRALGIVPSVASVWLIHRLGARLLSAEIGCVAAFYQAISTFQIFYAQEARCFSLLVCFCLLSSLALWNALESGSPADRFRWHAAYVVATALTLYTHFIAVFFFAGQGCFVLLRRRRQLRAYIASAVATGALFLPWLIVMFRAAGAGGQQGRRYLWLKLPQAYFSFMFGDTLAPLDEQAVRHLRETVLAHAHLLAGAALSAAALGLFAWAAWRRWQDRLLYAVTMAVVPVLLAFAVSFKVMMFDERYLIPASPFVYLVVSAAAIEVFRRREHAGLRRGGAVAVSVYAALLAVSLWHYYFDSRFGKEQWREAVAYLESVSSPDDFLILDPDYLEPPYRYYRKRELPYLKASPAVAKEVAASPETLLRRVEGHSRVWVITANYDEETVAGIARGLFVEETRRTFSKAHGIDIASFRVVRR